MEKFDKVIDFLKANSWIDFSGGIFSTRNTIGDYVENVYCEDHIEIDYCGEYSYIEILGLKKEEFEELSNRIWEEVSHYDPEDDIE